MIHPIAHTFYFGRLIILGKWENKHDYVLNSLRSQVIEESGKFKYGYFDPEELIIQNEDFTYGRLVKYKPLLEGEIVNERTHQVVEGGLELGVVAKSDYYLHIRTGVIAFHPIANRLSEKQFREMFSRLFEAANHNFFIQATIELIDEQFKIQEAIRRFQIISRIVFDVHPTNPSANPIYEDVDKRMKELEAEKIKTEIIGRDGRLNKEVLLKDEAYRAVIMAADGFGSACVRGIMDDRRATITTGESPVMKEVLGSDSPIDELKQLFPIFQEIWERMTK